MQNDCVSAIKEIEKDAEMILLDAEEKANKMLSDTQRSCELFLEKEKVIAVAQEKEKLETLRDKSNALLEKNEKISEALAKDYYEDIKPKLHGAVEIILQEIEKQCQ